MIIASLLKGWFGTSGDNEVELVSTISDPTKVRHAVPYNLVESNLGGMSGNVRRADGNHEEYGLFMFRLTPDKKAGAAYIAVRPPDSEDVVESLYIGHNVIISQVPIIAPNIGAGGDNVAPTRFYSDDRRYCFNVQGDGGGKIVQYDTHGTTDEKKWTPVSQWRGEPL